MEDQELITEFVSESLQGLESIEKDLLALESDGGSDRELVNRVFRAVHSIKGTGSYMGLDNLVRLSHLAETVLDQIRSGQRSVTPEVTDAILGAVDCLVEMLQSPDLGQVSLDSNAITKLDAVLGNHVLENNHTEKPSSLPASGSVDLAVVANAWNGKFFVYEIRVDLEALHCTVDLKEGVVKGLSSVGKILHSTIPLAAIDKTFQGECILYYETVLETDLITDHFHIDPANIRRLKLDKASSPKTISTTNSTCSKPESSRPSAPTTLNSQPSTLNQTTPNQTTPKAAAEQTMRVPVHILHELLEWTGTMVMARNQLMNEFSFSGNTAFRTLSQAISGVHETVIETRMQTTGSLFERYRRVVRDLSRQLGKEVALHIEGGDLELDRSILESFADPLTHLIRNCVDHALETPAEREAAGKNRQGNVYLRSYIQSGEIILEVQDDGRGICANRICEKAVSKGVITAEEAASMSEHDKVLLIFRAGFSTKDQATDVSGRGVGMDVVRNNIETVGGMIDVQTRVGFGSTFAAILPLAKALVSSSLTKALIVELNGEQFAIPETAISEIIRFDSKAKNKLIQVDGQRCYQLRDKLVAIVDLSNALSLNEGANSKIESEAVECETVECDNASNLSLDIEGCLVVFQYRKYFFGAVVNRVVGVQEIIVRSTPRLIQNCAVYSGHTVLGTGQVALILDINGLVQKLNLKFCEPMIFDQSQNSAGTTGISTGISNLATKKRVRQKMLVFSYADGEYFAIPLELVAIVERITPDDLRMVGQKEYCQLKQETISVMRLDKFLPINKIDSNRKDCCLVRAAGVSFPIGILTGPDVCVVEVEDAIETRMNDSTGILGTFLHRNRLIMLLDIYSVFEQHAPEKINLQAIQTSRARILIVEDSLFFRRLVSQYVACDDWETEIVNDGLEAWERLQQEPTRYQLVISDINMPRMDGFELVTRVREDRRFDLMPMIALTTLTEDQSRGKGLALGFDRYVIKIDQQQVRQTVAECLKIKRNPVRREQES